MNLSLICFSKTQLKHMCFCNGKLTDRMTFKNKNKNFECESKDIFNKVSFKQSQIELKNHYFFFF